MMIKSTLYNISAFINTNRLVIVCDICTHKHTNRTRISTPQIYSTHCLNTHASARSFGVVFDLKIEHDGIAVNFKCIQMAAVHWNGGAVSIFFFFRNRPNSAFKFKYIDNLMILLAFNQPNGWQQ